MGYSSAENPLVKGSVEEGLLRQIRNSSMSLRDVAAHFKQYRSLFTHGRNFNEFTEEDIKGIADYVFPRVAADLLLRSSTTELHLTNDYEDFEKRCTHRHIPRSRSRWYGMDQDKHDKIYIFSSGDSAQMELLQLIGYYGLLKEKAEDPRYEAYVATILHNHFSGDFKHDPGRIRQLVDNFIDGDMRIVVEQRAGKPTAGQLLIQQAHESYQELTSQYQLRSERNAFLFSNDFSIPAHLLAPYLSFDDMRYMFAHQNEFGKLGESLKVIYASGLQGKDLEHSVRAACIMALNKYNDNSSTVDGRIVQMKRSTINPHTKTQSGIYEVVSRNQSPTADRLQVLHPDTISDALLSQYPESLQDSLKVLQKKKCAIFFHSYAVGDLTEDIGLQTMQVFGTSTIGEIGKIGAIYSGRQRNLQVGDLVTPVEVYLPRQSHQLKLKNEARSEHDVSIMTCTGVLAQCLPEFTYLINSRRAQTVNMEHLFLQRLRESNFYPKLIVLDYISDIVHLDQYNADHASKISSGMDGRGDLAVLTATSRWLQEYARVA